MQNYLVSVKFWKELAIMTFGMLFAAIAVHFFLVPSNLIIGSISGFSIVVFRITGIPVSMAVLILNFILLILAYFLIGKEFGTKTVYTAFILSPWLYLLETYFPQKESLMGDPWFDLLCFVLMLSIIQAVLFRINASTGGLDILAKLANKYLHIEIGTSITIAGGLICCTSFFINDLRMVIIGLIGTWINGLAVDYFTAGLNKKKRVCIISTDYKKIQNYIITELIRGATLYPVIGGYSNENKVELETILTMAEFSELMNFIEKKQIQAFITAGNVNEIYGYWITKKNRSV